MTHLSLLTCSEYADGALLPEATAEVERHLAACAECRGRVDGLAAESRALRAAMQATSVTDEAPAFVPRPSIAQLVAWLGATMLVAWGVNVAWISLTSSAALPSWLGWLSPDAGGVGVERASTPSWRTCRWS